jgi:2,4-dienoyl-CoA reductase-like NADH-dependent reductase (Old Yellow Enzyme family)/thioredoxin reductase
MMQLRNNFMMAPVKLGYCTTQGFVNQKHLTFYEERSKHIGAVALEPLYIDSGLREIPKQLGIDHDDKIVGLKQITDLIHNNGAKAIAHLNHPGRMANPMIPNNYWWSSVDAACPNGGKVPEAMNLEKMKLVKNLMVDASLRAEKAGFDMIEIQFGHGYLFAQFISPAVNNRTDEYGGSFDNRIRFPMEILESIQLVVNIPIMIRLTADEFIPNGIHIDEAIILSKIIENKGISALHITAASACETPPWFFQHMFTPKSKTWELAAKIQEKVNIPVFFLGRINKLEDIKTIQNQFNGKYFAIGRAMVADENFIGKILGTVSGNIRPCLACSEGCLGGVKSGNGLGCVVNPRLNSNNIQSIATSSFKKIAVVGGGLAGMEAAINLKAKGYRVDLYEKSELGGQFNLASLPPKKESLKELVDFYKSEISLYKVNVLYQEATLNKLLSEEYDHIVLASGAVPKIPPIKGLKKYHWTAFLDDKFTPHKQRILIIGGGLIGLEMASKLIDNENSIIIVEMLDEIAKGMEMLEKTLTIKKLQEKSAEILIQHKVVEIDNDKVSILNPEHEIIDRWIDEIIVAIGMESYLPFSIDGLQNIHIIGDASMVGKAQEAIQNAYNISQTI